MVSAFTNQMPAAPTHPPTIFGRVVRFLLRRILDISSDDMLTVQLSWSYFVLCNVKVK